MEDGNKVAMIILANLHDHLQDNIVTIMDFVLELERRGLFGAEKNISGPQFLAMLTTGGGDIVHRLLGYMFSHYNDEMLERFYTFLDDYATPDRPRLIGVAQKIRDDLKTPSAIMVTSKPQADNVSGPSDMLSQRSTAASGDNMAGILQMLGNISVPVSSFESPGNVLGHGSTSPVAGVKQTQLKDKSTSAVALDMSLEQGSTSSKVVDVKRGQLKDEPTLEKAKRKTAGRKPRFEDRDVDAHVYWNGLHEWQWVFSAEAVDEETGISAKGENYKSKKGAIKHARKNLEAVLLKHGIIDSDDVHGDIPTAPGVDVPTANDQSSPVKDDVPKSLHDNSSSDLNPIHKLSDDNILETDPQFGAKFMNAAIEEGGSVEVEIVKVVTLGPPEAGKTQLKRALTGNMQESTESTPLSTGAEVIMQRFFDGGTNSKWEILGKAELQAALYNVVEEGNYTTEAGTTSVSGEPKKQTFSKQEDSTLFTFPTDEELPLQADVGNSRHQNSSPNFLLQDFKKLQDTVLSSFLKSQGDRQLNGVRIIHFVDSGGQPAFFDLHPVVATSRAVYLIVYNSAEGLLVRPKITYRKSKDSKGSLPNPNQTNLDMIKRSLSTLHHCKEKFLEMEERQKKYLQTMNFTMASGNSLPIVIVGSRKNDRKPKDRDDIEVLEEHCSHIPTWHDDAMKRVRFVESLDASDQGIDELRKDVMKAKFNFKIQFPLKWFYCQLIFLSTEDPALSVLSYCNLQDLCLQGGLVAQEEEFRALVTTFHMLGVFSCPDLDDVNVSKEHLKCSPVFTKPEVLYEQVSTVMTIPFRDLKRDRKLKQSQYIAFTTLQESGIITQESLKLLKIPDPIGSFSRFHLYLLKYLVKWGLAAEIMETDPEPELPGSSQELLIVSPKLFIPSILPPYTEYKFAPEGSDIPAFALTILDRKSEDYSIPQGLFPHFVVDIMNRREDGYIIKISKGRATPRCRDVLAITRKAQEGVKYPYTIYVVENIDHVAVHIGPDHRSADNTPQWEPSECNIILSDLKDAMEKAYSRLYQKKDERMSTILACECCCPLVKTKPHLAKVDCQREPPIMRCLSPDSVANFQKECDSTMKAIVQPKTGKDCPSKLKNGSVINSTFEFLPFLDDMIAHLIPLGTTLGIDNYAMALKNSSEEPDAKCLSVLKCWLERTSGATWTMFCNKLEKVSAFNNLRARIFSEKCCNNGH